MAFPQDVLTRIVNIQWTPKGAIFVAAGVAEMILRAELNKSDIEAWRGQSEEDRQSLFEVISPPDDFIGESERGKIVAGSYRKVAIEGGAGTPVFLLGGNDQSRNPETLSTHTWGVIMQSNDGKQWTLAGKLETGDHEQNDAGILALVWDNGFYAYGRSTEYYTNPPSIRLEFDNYEVLLSSKDGVLFEEEDRTLTYNSEEGGPQDLERPNAFEEHFTNPAKLPDGSFGYYEQRDNEGEIVESFLAVPKEPTHYWLGYTNALPDGGSTTFDGRYASKAVDITIFKDGEELKQSKETPIWVNGVAYVDGILMACGRDVDLVAAIACSIDQGETWDTVWTAEKDYMQEVWVIMGAPKQDLAQGEA